MARAVNEFELSQEWIRYEQSKGPDIRHHEQNESKKKAFVDQVRALIDTFEKMGNPILKKSDDLFVLDTHDIADPKVVQTVRNTEQIGNKRPTGLNGHLSIRDFTLTSCQKGSYLYINSPIIE